MKAWTQSIQENNAPEHGEPGGTDIGAVESLMLGYERSFTHKPEDLDFREFCYAPG